MEEPFMTTVFTASSHHPFRVPKVYKGRFEQGSHPIHQCIGYTDYALQRFFEYAQQQSWYDNTLFVLTADHTNELSYAEYSNAKGIFEVPIAFYSPRWNEGKLEQQGAVSQTDIMPSILSYLQYKNTYFAFGEDILTTDKKHPYAICYNHPVYQLFSDSILIQYDGKDVIGVYNYLDDKYLENNIIEQINIDDMIVYLKAYIQQYIHRITTNQLTVTKNGSTSR
jgi:phosphoglycerol transferase MdoB-like AlkP superfamily enzyme